jgi:hypothetical protein
VLYVELDQEIGADELQFALPVVILPEWTSGRNARRGCNFPNYLEALISTIIVVAVVFRVAPLLAGISVLRLERFNQWLPRVLAVE